jgi:hypothetical protein
MNVVRTKIIAFWVLFLVFCLLLWYSWPHRLLWIAIFIPIWLIIGFTKPQLPRPSRQVALLFRVGLILMLAAVFIHALQPSSHTLLMLAKVLCVLFIVPRLCYQAYRDYGVFRSTSG